MLSKFILTYLLILLSFYGFSKRYYSSSDIHNLAQNKLTIDSKKSYAVSMQRYKPNAKSVTAFTNDGKTFKLYQSDIVALLYIRTGNFKGIKGDWIEFIPRRVSNMPASVGYYVPLKRMKNVEAELSATEKRETTYQSQDSSFSFRWEKEYWIPVILGGGFILFLFIIYLIGGGAGGDYSSYTENKPKEEMFYGDGRMRYGTRNCMGGYTETFSGANYRPETMGGYTKKR